MEVCKVGDGAGEGLVSVEVWFDAVGESHTVVSKIVENIEVLLGLVFYLLRIEGIHEVQFVNCACEAADKSRQVMLRICKSPIRQPWQRDN